ncbi:DegV family protein [Desnuesiella massiliensis]|uniref:DegV family protein n=1 Tax=Desnuesiella massiliensis TaxID=1650662 RepID=UPI0006E193C3|nr:DegV family protein [Desnuesiella massiliensis]
MEKIALIADSTCDLDKNIIEKYNIHILPLRVIYKDKEYIDRVDITPQEVYDSLKNETPKTSLPSMNDMESLLTRLEEEGYTHTIIIPISSGLSGTFNSLKLVSEHHPKLTTTVFDSKSLSLGAGALIIECAKLIEANMPYEEIVAKLPLIQEKISLYFIVDTLEYLKKGGRIGRVSGTIGELLNIKPIISVNDDGVYYTYSKVRGKKQAISKLLDLAEEYLKSTRCKVWIMHGGALEEGQKVYNTIKTYSNISELGFGEISPVAGVHAGPGLVGLVVVKED